MLVNLTPVQNFIAHKAAKLLSDKLETKVTIDKVRIDFLNHAVLKGLYVEDRAKDTLLYAGEAELRITDWFFMKDEVPVITYVGLENAYGHLYRKANDSVWNYQFVIDAFKTAPSGKKKKQELEIDLDKIKLRAVRFHMDDAWAGKDMNFDLDEVDIDAKEIGLKNKRIEIAEIRLASSSIFLRDYRGGRPRDSTKINVEIIDSTAFNPDNWVLKLDKLSLENCRFVREGNNRPAPVFRFDGEHMDLTNINLKAEALRVDKDTLHARLTHLSGKERCGFELLNMQADITVSPNESVAENLLLQTPKSSVGNYYAMRYDRFPDFKDYIASVRMEAHMDSTVVDFQELAYFAPNLKEFPARVAAKGIFNGTVDDFKLTDFGMTDGSTGVQGEFFSMTGLPDIYNTFIHYQGGAIQTTGADVLRYVPSLRGNPNLALETLSFIRFNGGFTGFLENFAANGVLQTNLGNAKSDVEMKLPLNTNGLPVYNGHITTTGFNLGSLIRQPSIGLLSMNGEIQGNGFDPLHSQLKVKTQISSFSILGYTYHNILADGVLAKRKFEGQLIVDDSNLAASFNGTADFSGKRPVIVAESHVLYSNLQRMNLTEDLVTLSADFDLNASGSTMDNFLGDARLYNINLRRNIDRLDVDSLTLSATETGSDTKQIVIESNLLSARINGHYDLSKMANSIQYFLAGYLPNYIPKPRGYAPDQQITFEVHTRIIDGLFKVLLPQLTGFNNSTVVGELNTSRQQLDLSVEVPQGSISGVKFSTVRMQGTGNFNNLTVTGDVAQLNIGDSLINLSANVKTTIGNDSVRFNIDTQSPFSFGTASVNGAGFARGDSLFAYFEPSEFYFNGTKWEIPGGNLLTFSKKYLQIDDLYVHSGLQQVAFQSNDEGTLVATMQNIDLGQLTAIAKLGELQPDGRLNGTVQIQEIFTNLNVDGNIRATGLRLGVDTIGEVVIKGNYNEKQRAFVLKEGSGIFRPNSSITIFGTLITDTTSNQKIAGRIHLNNAPISWLSPVLRGYVSNVEGKLDGSINFAGTAAQPEVDGSVDITNAKLRVDYLGTTYSIPSAKVGITPNAFNMGTITLLDAYNKEATLTGSVTHNRFKDFQLGLNLVSDEFELVNLKEYENSVFYGHLIADARVSVSGPVDNVRINISKAVPVQKSQLYLPLTDDGGTGTYSYISFLQIGDQKAEKNNQKNRLSLSINALANPLLEVTMILDATTGDRITATGNGSLLLEMPAGEDLRMYGNYEIESGTYTFTFKKLVFTREFMINSGSRISFSGPMESTELDVRATYRTRASLYDLLDTRELSAFRDESPTEQADTKRLQDVNVQLAMKGKLTLPELGFKIELPEKRSVGTTAYAKLDRLNQNDQLLFEQVASLLLIGYFLPPEGITGTSGATATTGAVNNLSQILSTSTSQQLTNIVNKVLGDKRLSVEFKYKNYNLSDGSTNDILNRNEVKLGLRRNFFNDRLVVEVGSAYDWGRPTASNTSASNFNILGDFRLQYLLTEGGRLRLNTFHTSNYDALAATTNLRNISRTGIGISWRKSFDTIGDFFKSEKAIHREQEDAMMGNSTLDSTSVKKAGS